MSTQPSAEVAIPEIANGWIGIVQRVIAVAIQGKREGKGALLIVVEAVGKGYCVLFGFGQVSLSGREVQNGIAWDARQKARRARLGIGTSLAFFP